MSQPEPRIVRTPGVLGGKPRLDGTRWPTEIVVGFDFDLFAIKDAYPHLSMRQIVMAIRYERLSPRRVLGRAVRHQRIRLARWIAGDDWEGEDDR